MFPVTSIRKASLTRMTAVGLLTYGLLFSAGCASMPRTPLRSSDNSLNLDNGSVYLLSIKTDNKFHTGWPPEVQHLVVRDDGSGEEIDFLTIEGSLWAKATHDAFTTKRDQRSESLVGLNLPPGSYHLWTIAGGATKGVGVAALSSSFSFPFDIPFGSQGKEIVYLGNVEMVNRERKSDDELPSAPALPLINPGFSGSTFDVTIADKYEEDVPRFREKFPALGTQAISRRVLPQWQRPKRTEKKGN